MIFILFKAFKALKLLDKKFEIIRLIIDTWKKVDCKPKKDTVLAMPHTMSQSIAKCSSLVKYKPKDTRKNKTKQTQQVTTTKSDPKLPTPARKNKVIIVGDSHVKSLGEKVQNSLGVNTSVSTFSRPGAPFKHVIGDLAELTSQLSLEDEVIIFAGSNDIRQDTQRQYVPDLTLIEQVAAYTNVKVVLVPNRFDSSSFIKKH